MQKTLRVFACLFFIVAFLSLAISALSFIKIIADYYNTDFDVYLLSIICLITSAFCFVFGIVLRWMGDINNNLVKIRESIDSSVLTLNESIKRTNEINTQLLNRTDKNNNIDVT